MMEMKRDLKTRDVFAISAGAMISSGLFILPALAFAKSGPAVIIAYLISALLAVPAMFSKAELATAMPKSGGVYFFITRSFGALFGSFAGFASWFSLSLKSAFALVGIGVFLQVLLPWVPPGAGKIIAIGFTVIFAVLNILSVKESGRFQFFLVLFLLSILLFYVIAGLRMIDVVRFEPFAPAGISSIALVTGMIFVSYGGLTKVASVAEEVADPGRSIPRGMFSAFLVVSVGYVLAIFVTVGVSEPSSFADSVMPLSLAARITGGNLGYVLLTIAAMIAFVTTANAGLLAASRAPLAMSRDHLVPQIFARVNKRLQTPIISILLTSVFMIAAIVFLNLESLVKVASTMKLLLFTSVNLSVIMMRQSRVVSYRPVFRSPLYPYLQIGGIAAYLFLISQMGVLPLALSGGFFILSLVWYLVYARSRATQESAFIHMVSDLAERDVEEDKATLTGELIEILRDRDEIEEDRFDSIIRRSPVLDLQETITRDAFFDEIAGIVSERWGLERKSIREKLIEREGLASTLIYPGVAVPHAIPHAVLEGNALFDIVLTRNKFGIVWNDQNEIVYTSFCLIGTKDEREFHLKALMSIAQVLQDPDFNKLWTSARNAEELRSVVLTTKRRRS